MVPDARAAQIERLKEQVCGLKERIAARDEQIGGLTDFRKRALIAAQRMEIERLRDALAAPSNVRALPNSSRASAPYGSGS